MEYKFELVEAIEARDLGAFRKLFELSDLECDDYNGTLLHCAARSGTVEIVGFLVQSGAEVNQTGGRSKLLPITCAAMSGNVEIVRYLIEEAGSKVDTTHPRVNPLLRASMRGEFDVVNYLLDTGVDPHLTYRLPSGKLTNAYLEAESSGSERVVKLLEAHGCRKPIEGEDIPIWEPSQERLLNHTFGAPDSRAAGELQRYQQITRYMEDRFGPTDREAMQELVPVIEGMSVAINVIQPNEKNPFWVLFTNGMSDLPMKVPQGQEAWQYAELVMHLPPHWVHPRQAGADLQWLWPVKWLRTFAYQPHLNDSWLGLPATIASSADPPEPLGPNTKQSCLLILPDVAKLKPPLQTDDRQIHFYTMVPIYTEERDFELNHGMDEFFSKFLESEIPLTVDLNRPNFASSR